jgi:hypothetical protein
MKLTDQQEEIVRNCVDAQGLKLKNLRDDVIDHLCCAIESQLRKGKAFDQLLQDAMAEIAPNGLIDLEHKTIFLLNSKRIIIMKKFLYLIGFIGSVTFTAGVTFKLLHMSGGNELFIAGFLIILLVFIPLLAFDRYKVAISGALSERLKIIFGVSAAVITGISGLFKLLHLAGAAWLLLLGAFVFVAGFLPFLFFTMYKKSVS